MQQNEPRYHHTAKLCKRVLYKNELSRSGDGRCWLVTTDKLTIGTDFLRTMVASTQRRIPPHRALPHEELDLRHECERLFSEKSTKTADTRVALFDSSMHQIVCQLGLCPRPHWRSLQCSPRSPSWV